MSSRFNELLRRAQGAISNFRTGGSGFFLGRSGEVIFSKNNVCVHESTAAFGTNIAEEPVHTPGYLSIHCLDDEQLGTSLVLQWLPNALLEKNPTSIRCVSPRPVESGGGDGSATGQQGGQCLVKRYACSNRVRSSSEEEEEGEGEEESTMTAGSSSFGTGIGTDGDETPLLVDSKASTAICLELNGAASCESEFGQGQRPVTLLGAGSIDGQGLAVPSIHVIPNTPVEQQQGLEEDIREKSESSGATSGEDEPEEGEEEGEGDGEEKPPSSCDEADGNGDMEVAKAKSCSLDALRQSCAASLQLGSIPEQFALEHNLVLKGEEAPGEEGGEEDEARLAMAKERVHFARANSKEMANSSTGVKQKSGREAAIPAVAVPPLCSLFSVNLGKMRSMRVFYSDPGRTSGQLVIASPGSQYKIFHFHHAGLDKLAALFERWNAVKAKSAGNDSPSVSGPDQHLMICPDGGNLAKIEMDPEDGLYEKLNWDIWRSSISKDGSIEDPATIRKVNLKLVKTSK